MWETSLLNTEVINSPLLFTQRNNHKIILLELGTAWEILQFHQPPNERHSLFPASAPSPLPSNYSVNTSSINNGTRAHSWLLQTALIAKKIPATLLFPFTFPSFVILSKHEYFSLFLMTVLWKSRWPWQSLGGFLSAGTMPGNSHILLPISLSPCCLHPTEHRMSCQGPCQGTSQNCVLGSW